MDTTKVQRIDRLCDGFTRLYFQPHVLSRVLMELDDPMLDRLEQLLQQATERGDQQQGGAS